MTDMVVKKPRLLWVDHSYHQRTMSTNFLKVILERQFNVSVFWDDYWRGGDSLPVSNINTYDYVFFFQTLLPFHRLKEIKVKIVWVPMLDSDHLSDKYWYCLSSIPLKIISFSNYFHEKCLQFQIESLSLKYYLPPAFNEDIPKSGRHYFFWYRGNLSFSEIKEFLKFQKIDSFVYRSAPDPFHKEEIFSEEDLEKYKVEIIRDLKFESKERYLKQLKKANIFIAPRKIEGIGISFLEAIAMGMVVIGYNNGTMNEYISNNYNGYLFDSKNYHVNTDNLETVINNSKKSAYDGWIKWETDKNKINDFILNDTYKKSNISRTYFFIYSSAQLLENYLRKTLKRLIKKLMVIIKIKSS
jgi:glycosyltransferase involved in cell wall biosynthesis